MNSEEYPVGGASTDLHSGQSDYLALKDSLSNVLLPGSLTIGDSSFSLKPESRTKVSFIKRNASYVQTGLKLLKQIGDRGSFCESDLDSIYTIL